QIQADHDAFRVGATEGDAARVWQPSRPGAVDSHRKFRCEKVTLDAVAQCRHIARRRKIANDSRRGTKGHCQRNVLRSGPTPALLRAAKEMAVEHQSLTHV